MADRSIRKPTERDKTRDPGTAIHNKKMPKHAGQVSAGGSKSAKISSEIIHGPNDDSSPGDESLRDTDSDAK